MREARTDLLVELPKSYNTTQLLIDRMNRENADPDSASPLYAVKDSSGRWTEISTPRYVALVRRLAKSLIDRGVEPGSMVAIMSRTRYEWALVEQAVWFAGAVSVPVYETSSAVQVEWILRDSGARHVFAESAERAAVVEDAVEKLGEDVQIFCFDAAHSVGGGAAGEATGGVVPAGLTAGSDLALLLAAGARSRVSDAQVEDARTSAGYSDTATLVYTSGTTGRAKGCVMTHGNFAGVAVNLVPHMREVVHGRSRTLMFLPLAHVLARAVQQCCVHSGTTVAHGPDVADLMGDLAGFKPTFLLAVPRIFEKVRAGALSKAEESGRGRLFARAERIAIEVSRHRDAVGRGAGTRLPLSVRAQHAFFDRVLYPKLRAVLGGEAKFAISGASELGEDLAHFFRGAGVQLLEGYGLTESTAPATVNQPDYVRVGSVGFPTPGTTVRIADDSEVQLRGVGVFAGYHGNGEATAAAFTEDGFFATGDLGELDEDGFLTITGRKKDLIVTAGGKNVSPGPLEELIRAWRIVDQVVLVGDQRPFVAALVTLDTGELPQWAAARGLEGLDVARAAGHPEVLSEIQAAVDAANKTVSHAEGVKKFTIVDREFTEASGHLTPSMKLKRAAVVETCAGEIEELYRR
ncbi:AMP-dependent synthetase/ligase [Zhihengliuella salsuginis]|uniref:Acyl-CoA synthetase n=1 Tax=Zhihengliuella salsuginis TaxID=578222 RepID=A0ABQ3GM04_9MICC|nr:AMP-dependent synthetase/ligase [Zhihengliuella salsuginis]GHD09711.1 long-chain acyl-CoA synthetase [Zhihengliuella salsuginis]